MRRLSVVLDAVAALREASGAEALPLAACAALAESAGADAVRLGLAETLRPVREADVRAVGAVVRGLELRMAPSPALLKIALDARPERVILAGEPAPGRVETEPLEPGTTARELAAAVRTLGEAGIATRACVTPELEAVKRAHGAGLEGVELFTGRCLDLPPDEREAAWERVADAARLAAKLRLRVGLGGGLERRSLPALLEHVPVVERVALGRDLVGAALVMGLERAVRDRIAALG